MKKMGSMDIVAYILIIIGGINWGLYGLLNVDLVALIFGDYSILSRIVYILVGLAAIYVAYTLLTKED